MSQMSWGRMLRTATRRSARERWNMRWYMRDDGFRRSCRRSAASTTALLDRAARKMTACSMRGEETGSEIGELIAIPYKFQIYCFFS